MADNKPAKKQSTPPIVEESALEKVNSRLEQFNAKFDQKFQEFEARFYSFQDESRRSQERILALLVRLVTNNSSRLPVQASSPGFDTAPLPVVNKPRPLASELTVEHCAPQAYNDSHSLSANAPASFSGLSDYGLSEPVTDSADDETADELDQSCASSTLVAICHDDASTVVCCDASNCSPALVVVDPTFVLSCLRALMYLQHQPIFATKLYRKPLTFFSSLMSAPFATSFAFLVSVLMVVLFVLTLSMTLLVPKNWKKRLKFHLALYSPRA
jgi:hypothetical protein